MALDDYQRSIRTNLNPLLLIGEPSIDKEHYELIKQLEDLVGSPAAIPVTESFSETLSQLGGQINAHFNHEEQFFRSLGMPDELVRSHVEAHTEILDQYAQLNLDLMQGKEFSRSDVLQLIKSWVVEHVVLHDLGIKQYVSAKALSLPERGS